MKSYEEVYEVVKQILSKERFNHSIGVMERCKEFAILNNVDVEKAKLIGIAHDIMKEIPKSDRVRVAIEYGIKLDDFEKENTGLIHAKLGAKVCRDRFGFTEDMCRAIEAHTTAKSNMQILDKILYLSDYCEPGRDFDVNPVYEIGKSNLNEGFYQALIGKINYTLKRGAKIHKDSIDAYNTFLDERNGKNIESKEVNQADFVR